MTDMELNDFINKEIELWGEDYIVSLLDQGYMPVMSDRGPKWLAPEIATNSLDNSTELCYVGEVASPPAKLTPVRLVGTKA